MRTLVIGAGSIGLMAAYELRRRGVEVVLIDKGEPGMACSSGNTGWVVPSFAGPLPAPGVVRQTLAWMLRPDSPFYIRPRLDLSLLSWLWQFWRHCNPRDHQAGLEAIAGLNRQTLALFDALQADGVAFPMHAQGVLFAFVTEAAQHAVLRDLRDLVPYGFDAPDAMDHARVRAFEPALSPDVVGGVFAPGERHLSPEAFNAAVIRRIREMGVTVRSGIAVRGAASAHGRAIAVETSGGRIEADTFLIAAGVWSVTISAHFGFTFPLQAGTGYSLTFADSPVRLRHAVYLDEARVACSPFADALRLAGTMELSGFSPTLGPRRLAPIERAARRYFDRWNPHATGVPWLGMRPVTPDGLPVIGRVPGLDNVFLATGHGMLGITLAPATGAALAALICGTSGEFDLAAFDPARFARRGHAAG
jgi:D-amino-acid dehydrogenase